MLSVSESKVRRYQREACGVIVAISKSKQLFSQEMEEDPYFVPTRCSAMNAFKSHQTVTFETKKRTKKHGAEQAEAGEPIQREEIVDMKRARFDVYKFSRTGLSSADRQKSDVELALQLGAVPPKNKAVNYKKLKEDAVRSRREAEKEANRLGKHIKAVTVGSGVKKPRDPKAAVKRKRKIGSGILNTYGQVSKKKLKSRK